LPTEYVAFCRACKDIFTVWKNNDKIIPSEALSKDNIHCKCGGELIIIKAMKEKEKGHFSC